MIRSGPASAEPESARTTKAAIVSRNGVAFNIHVTKTKKATTLFDVTHQQEDISSKRSIIMRLVDVLFVI